VVGTAFWAVTAATANISSVSGSKIGDYFINAGTATVTILGQSTTVGGVVKSTSATAGTASGNIRGPQGATGAQGASGATSAVNQQANLASNTAANSVTSTTIGVTGTLLVANGGTGAATVATANQVFRNTTAGGAPAFGALAADHLPTVTVAKGGTNKTSISTNAMLYATAANTYGETAANSTANRVLRTGTANSTPTWSQVNLNTDVTGQLSVLNLPNITSLSVLANFTDSTGNPQGYNIGTLVQNIPANSVADGMLSKMPPYTVKGNIGPYELSPSNIGMDGLLANLFTNGGINSNPSYVPLIFNNFVGNGYLESKVFQNIMITGQPYSNTRISQQVNLDNTTDCTFMDWVHSNTASGDWPTGGWNAFLNIIYQNNPSAYQSQIAFGTQNSGQPYRIFARDKNGSSYNRWKSIGPWMPSPIITMAPNTPPANPVSRTRAGYIRFINNGSIASGSINADCYVEGDVFQVSIKNNSNINATVTARIYHVNDAGTQLGQDVFTLCPFSNNASGFICTYIKGASDIELQNVISLNAGLGTGYIL